MTSVFHFKLILINSSGLNDEYSAMVAEKAGPSRVKNGHGDNDEDHVEDDDDDDFTFKRRCKPVVAIPDRLDVHEFLKYF